MANQHILRDDSPTSDAAAGGKNGTQPLALKSTMHVPAPTPTVTVPMPTSILRKEGHSPSTITTNTDSPVTKVKCILFNLEPILHSIPSRSELTAEEVDNAWFCRLELEAMAAAALDPTNERNNNHSGGCRGLERYTTAGSTRLEIHRVQVVAAVLREQERQRQSQQQQQDHRSKPPKRSSWFSSASNTTAPPPTTTKLDDLLIAQAAHQMSRECQELAIRQGYNDEVEAHGAIHTDGVDLKSPSILKQMQALHDMRFLEQAKQKRLQQRRHNQPTD